jgi:hypothetical protein
MSAIIRRDGIRAAREIVVAMLINSQEPHLLGEGTLYFMTERHQTIPVRLANAGSKPLVIGHSYELVCIEGVWFVRGPATTWGSR